MSQQITVHLTLFASLRDQAGIDQLTLLVEPCTVSELYLQTAADMQFDLPQSLVRFAANDQFVDADYEIQDGDRVVFLPPVSGG